MADILAVWEEEEVGLPAASRAETEDPSVAEVAERWWVAEWWGWRGWAGPPAAEEVTLGPAAPTTPATAAACK